MLDRFERPIKIICAGLALLLAWQLGNLILSGDPLARIKIPALPALAAATNAPAKIAQVDHGTNAFHGTNGTNLIAKTTNAPAAHETAQTNAIAKQGGPEKIGDRHAPPPGMTPGMMAQMMGGGMPGGPRGGGMKKMELPPEVQGRVDKIIDSEIFGPIMRPMPMALNGIGDQEACIQATTGQTGWVKIGGELGGIKLLRIGINRVLVEEDGEKKELTQFGGTGGESLMPPPTNSPATNVSGANAPSTNGPAKKASTRNATAHNDSTTPALSSKVKETP